MRILLLSLVFCQCVVGNQVPTVQQIKQSFGAFWRVEKVPSRFSTNDEFVYGNSKVGYFLISKKANAIRFIIPVYGESIELYALRGPTLIYWKSIQQRDTRESYLKALDCTQKKGKLTAPFYLTNIGIPATKEGSRAFYWLPAYFNRLGQLIYAFHPARTDDLIPVYNLAKPFPDGSIGLLSMWEPTTVSIYDVEGHPKMLFDLGELTPRGSIHHDFVPLANHRILYLGRSIAKVQHWQRLFLGPTRYIGTSLHVLDVKKQTSTKIWDTFDAFSPLEHFGFWGEMDVVDEIRWDREKPNGHVDFSHGNSVDCSSEELCLISLAGQSKIIAFDLKSKKIRWSFGNLKNNTIALPGGYIDFPHHATWTGENRFLFVDDREDRAGRIVEVEVNPLLQWFKVLGEYTPENKFTGRKMGSANKLPNGDYIAFLDRKDERVLSEVKPNGQEVGSLTFHWVGAQRTSGYRMYPLNQIGEERLFFRTVSNLTL